MGQTYDLQRQICEDLIEQIHEKAPVFHEVSDDVLLYRHLSEALAIYMGCHMNAISVTGYSDFHYSLIDKNNIRTAQPLPMLDPIRDEWELPINIMNDPKYFHAVSQEMASLDHM